MLIIKIHHKMKKAIYLFGFIFLFSMMVHAQEKSVKSVILITNASIFDGKSDALKNGMSVLIEDNLIKQVGTSIKAPEGATVIDAGGRTLTPGFIEAHAHLIGQMPFHEAMFEDTRYMGYVAAWTVGIYLQNGYTTVRDMGGNTYSLKKAIDHGYIEGPRIYTSGAIISQTAGHAEHRTLAQGSRLAGGQWDNLVLMGDCAVADGVPEVLTATRENLRMGASQIKIATAGGIAEGDPLDAIEWTAEEVQACTKAAADWGTYVTSHTYTEEGALRAIENGVKCIEHGNLLDEKTLLMMKEKGIWLSPQIMVFKNEIKGLNEEQKKKYEVVTTGTENLFAMAKKMGFEKLAFGTDVVTDPKTLVRVNEEFVYRTKWFTPAEVLRQATSVNGELMALSGNRNPYPHKLGVIEEGAYADILLIEGNPLKDISILTKSDENIKLIMKDGKVYKNTVK
jgi:imidazolonepropionase-like amidohydrolase